MAKRLFNLTKPSGTIDWNAKRRKVDTPIREIQWLRIPGYVNVEMSEHGVVRLISTKTIVTVYNSAVQLVTSDGCRVSRGLRKIKVALFPNADLEGEQWKSVEACPLYEVSSAGRVRKTDDRHIRKNQLRKGYDRVKIDAKMHMVHVLVARAFLPPPSQPSQTTVNHKNGIKDDNRVCNLEWASRSEQSLHAHASGLIARSERYRTVHQLQGNRVIATFKSIAEAARKTGLPNSSIGHVCSGTRPSTYGFKFLYDSESAKNFTTVEQNALDWVPVDGFPLYEICRDGLVRHAITHVSLSRKLIDSGYITVTLCVSDNDQLKKKPRPLHILLAKAFITNPQNLPVVHHRDENKTNNNIDNLQWVTAQQNTSASIGKPVGQYDSNMQLLRSWPTIAQAAKDIGLPSSTLCRYLGQSKIYDGLRYLNNDKHTES